MVVDPAYTPGQLGMEGRTDYGWVRLRDAGFPPRNLTRKLTKLEMTDELKHSIENDGMIRVSFELTPECEKRGDLPKRCSLDDERTVLRHKTGWAFAMHDYARDPTDYRYTYSYEGDRKNTKKYAAILKKRFEQYKREGAISAFRITSATIEDAMKLRYYW